MRICMILEGSYPYVHGGVSSWTHNYIKGMPDTEFVLWCIGAKEEDKGKFKYELPENVKEVHEVFLDSALKEPLPSRRKKKVRLDPQQEEALTKLFRSEDLDWDILFDLFQNRKVDPVGLLMSESFLNMIIENCRTKYPYISFSDYFYSVRSMMLPEMHLLSQEVPYADLYHATATGYSGLLGSLAKWKTGNPYVVTEHGIYTREREEELLRAEWVLPVFRQQWIDLFYIFSRCAYHHADVVTALFQRANTIQAELGADPEKLCVIPNGIHYENFCKIEPKKPDGFVDIGAVVRIARIKDIKTMIYAFSELKSSVPNARLHIMGDVDDREYDAECHQLIEQLGVKDILFTGIVNVMEYLKKIDFTILTSISEGQPLSVLESFAAGRPVVATDVGCCRELVEGTDEFGPAGIIVPPMNKDLLAGAMRMLCGQKELCREMAESGRARAKAYYTHERSMKMYLDLYERLLPNGKKED